MHTRQTNKNEGEQRLCTLSLNANTVLKTSVASYMQLKHTQ